MCSSTKGQTPPRQKGKHMPAQKLSAKEAAKELGTDARSLRKFLRSDASPIDPVGQGKRYEFSKGDVAKLKKVFLASTKVQTANGTAKKGKTIDIEVVTDPDELQDLIDSTTEEVDLDDDGDAVTLDDLDGPTDDDLEEIELD